MASVMITICNTYTELRRRVDELELHLLEIPTRSVDHERLADGDDTLLGAGDGALQHNEVVLDDTVMGEATHGCDRLLRDVVLSSRVTLVVTLADTVDLLVKLRTVVVAVCTAPSVANLPANANRTYFDRHGQQKT